MADTDLYLQYLRPKIAKLLALMKMDYVYHRGFGESLFTRFTERDDAAQEIEIKDFLGGYGTQFFGHHDTEIQQALIAAINLQVPFQSQASIKHYSTKLGVELNRLLKKEASLFSLRHDEDYISTMTNSGAESVEAAIKLCLSLWSTKKSSLQHQFMHLAAVSSSTQESTEILKSFNAVEEKSKTFKPIFISFQRSFHGKTSGAVALTANPEYSSMYGKLPIQVIFLDPDECLSVSKIEKIIEEKIPHLKAMYSDFGLTAFAGFIYEPIQAEGGIYPLRVETLKSMTDFAKKFQIPIIADEIQTGCMRCGHFVYSHALGISPDIILLGKALGGGLVKTGIMLAKQSNYNSDFGFKHTSTFAEDEISSFVTLKVLEILEKDKNIISEKADAFEKNIFSFFKKLQSNHPGIIEEVRGKGFLIGVEFASQHPKYSVIWQTLVNSGFGAYFLSSYMLKRKHIRIGVTLSSPMTLRIEPCYKISNKAIEKLQEGFTEIVNALDHGQTGLLTSHLWKDSGNLENIISPPIPREIDEIEKPKVCFFGHLVSSKHARRVDPLLNALSDRDLGKVLEVSEMIDLEGVIEEKNVLGVGNQKAQFMMYGFFNTSDYFEKKHRSHNVALIERLQKAVDELESQGVEYIGLGQFTSIVSWNGLALKTKPQTKITTGNSLTVATTLMSAEEIMKSFGNEFKDITVGVVGVTGNIGSVLSELMLGRVSKLKVFYRDQSGVSARFQSVYSNLEKIKIGTKTKLSSSSDLNELSDCDLIIVGTNSVKPIIFSNHLKKNAVVIDVAVPANVDPTVLKERKDVVCFSGGLVKLPKNQNVIQEFSGLPENEVFACLAETLMMALLKVDKPYSLGPLSRSSVEKVMEDFKKVGFELGQRTYMSSRL